MRSHVGARRGLIFAAAIALLPAAVWASIFRPGLALAILAAAPVVALLVWSLTWRLEKALIAYLFVHVLADTLKRLVFVVGVENVLVQYLPLAVKLSLLLALGAWGLGRRVAAGRLDGLDRVLLGFVALVVLSLVLSDSFSLEARAAMLPFSVGPYLIFFAYREAAATPGWRDRFLRTLVGLGLVAAAYGGVQAVVGPSWVDRAWAEASHTFSIQARNVWMAVTADVPMRPYSFFADHFSYGYFLVAALFGLWVGGWPRGRAARLAAAAVLLVALATAMTRAAGAAVLLAGLVAAALAVFPPVRRLFPALALAAYAVLSLAVTPVYERFFPEQSLDSAWARQTLSLGSLSARRDAGRAFLLAAERYPLLGDPGEGSGSRFVTAKLAPDLEEERLEREVDDAHNLLVGMVTIAGLPGCGLFVAFLVLVLRAAGRTAGPPDRAAAAVVGLLLAGVAGGFTVMAGLFMAWCAFAAPPPAPAAARAPRAACVEWAGGTHG
ncbi:MAG: hypothetical protein JXQ29_03165 [Planctomycetes bacterium]|nr:hypothetical protein [Planctomycetota bacterium]